MLVSSMSKSLIDLATGTPKPECLGAAALASFRLDESDIRGAYGYAPQAGDEPWELSTSWRPTCQGREPHSLSRIQRIEKH